ncbi:hypothetical protein OIU05_24860, partial [Escherichia coli]
AYTDRLKAHDLMALHYRRLLISYSAEELIGNMPHNAFKFLQYRLDNIEQAEAFIKYRNRNYQPRENADWPEPPEGVKRYVIRARS